MAGIVLTLLLAASTPAAMPTPLPSLPPAIAHQTMPGFSASDQAISVKRSQPFQIRLDVTSGTGYAWMPQGPLPAGVTLLGVLAQPRGKMLPGGPGREVLVFRGDQVVRARLTLEYVRPWERAAKPAKLATFTISIGR